LKLDKAVFETEVGALEESQWGAGGTERVRFLVQTNPGTPMGPLSKIASGGERARFFLALKVVLAKDADAATLIFDEVDQGVGGAVAAAVGERLSRLARSAQLLLVTHSPQIAARADHHFRIAKVSRRKGDATLVTRIERLEGAARREEVARMLSGAAITDEARAAAEKLIGTKPASKSVAGLGG
jgi:DNA repair protein RecN (Recombination protein N)